MLTATDRVLRSREQELARRRRDEEGEPRDGEEEEEEEVKILEEQASFEEVLVWGHEAVVDVGEDAYVRGVEEWIGFAESVCFVAPCVIFVVVGLEADGCEMRVLLLTRGG